MAVEETLTRRQITAHTKNLPWAPEIQASRIRIRAESILRSSQRWDRSAHGGRAVSSAMTFGNGREAGNKFNIRNDADRLTEGISDMVLLGRMSGREDRVGRSGA